MSDASFFVGVSQPGYITAAVTKANDPTMERKAGCVVYNVDVFMKGVRI